MGPNQYSQVILSAGIQRLHTRGLILRARALLCAATLKALYERHRLVFSHHYKAIFASDLINCTRKDLQRAMDKIERHCLEMRQANGYTADQIVVIHFEQCMSSKLVTAWRQFTYDQTDPPTTSDLLQFLRRQSLSAP